MFARDVVVIQGLGFPRGQFQDPLRPRRQRDLAEGNLVDGADPYLHLATRLRVRDRQGVKRLRYQALLLAEQAK